MDSPFDKKIQDIVDTRIQGIEDQKKNDPKYFSSNEQDAISNSQVFEDPAHIEFKDIYNKDMMQVGWGIPGNNAAGALVYGQFFIALFPVEVIEVAFVHEQAGSDAGAVTLQLEKLTGTQALDSGVNLLKTAIDLKSTAYTVQYPELTATKADRKLQRGDRLAMKDSGTLTNLRGPTLTVRLRPLGQGHYRSV